MSTEGRWGREPRPTSPTPGLGPPGLPAGRAGPREWVRRAGTVLLVLGSASTVTLARVSEVTLSGDRVVGVAALVVVVGLVALGRLRWTAIHLALAVFAGVQVATSLANAGSWPQGLKFATVYLLGFACFALAAAWSARPGDQRWALGVWIGIGVGLSLLGGTAAFFANHWQVPLWGTSPAVTERTSEGVRVVVFAARATFAEWNLLSSFLLVPFALGLWAWTRRPGGEIGLLGGGGWMAGIVWGVVFGLTRAVWLAAAGLTVFWWWLRRPCWQRLAMLGVATALAFAAQAAAIGASPLVFRGVTPLRTRQDFNLAGRAAINRAVFESWLKRPVLGHGAGSTNRLTVELRGRRLSRVWPGNMGLFLLHDSGVLGLGAFLGVLAVVASAAWRRARSARDEDEGWRLAGVPLVGAGLGLLFAYQFTHGLWVMYPYVYLGFLTAVLYPSDSGRDASDPDPPVAER